MTYLLNGIYKDDKVRFSSCSVVLGRAGGGVLEKLYCINNQTENSLLILPCKAIIFQFLDQLYPRTRRSFQHVQELHYSQQILVLEAHIP